MDSALEEMEIAGCLCLDLIVGDALFLAVEEEKVRYSTVQYGTVNTERVEKERRMQDIFLLFFT